MSSTDRQIAANRLNAQRSTGPRTPAGKAKVSVNALRHGLTAREVILPNENPDDFDAFRAELLTSLAPPRRARKFVGREDRSRRLAARPGAEV